MSGRGDCSGRGVALEGGRLGVIACWLDCIKGIYKATGN